MSEDEIFWLFISSCELLLLLELFVKIAQAFFLLMELEMSKGNPRFCEKCGVFLFPFESSERCYVCDGINPWGNARKRELSPAETAEEEGRSLVLEKIDSAHVTVRAEGGCSG